MRKLFFSRNKLATALLLLVLYVVSAVISYLLFSPEKADLISPVPDRVRPSEGFDTDPFSIPEITEAKIYNFLLLGYGGAGHSGGNLSDVLMVVSLNVTNKQVGLIAVPRDIWLKLSEDGQNKEQKINAAYVAGGGELAKKAVGMVVGMPIRHYVAASFEDFKELIDVLGGVEVEVSVAFDDYYYPIKGLENESCGKTPEEVEEILGTLSGFEIDKQFPCRYEHLHFNKGLQLMDGSTALKFVRSRHSAQHGGDFARSVRQQALLLGLKEKLVSLRAFEDFVPVFRLVIGKVKTDIDEHTVSELLTEYENIDAYPVKKINITTDNVLVSTTGSGGQYALVPKSGKGNWDEVHNYIKEQLIPADKN